MEQEYQDLLCGMIRNRAFTDNVEGVNRNVEMMKTFLEKRGLACTVEDLSGRKILYAATTPDKEQDILFNAHLDVVPATVESQYEPVIRDGKVIGRGAADCLGNAVLIAKVLCEARGKHAVSAVFTTDEETGGETTKAMMERGYAARRLIMVLDAWDDYNIAVAQKGILIVKLTATGKSGHASEPWFYPNPIEKLMRGCVRLFDVWKNPTPDAQWEDSMTPCIVSGGSANNQIPGEASVILNIRYIADERKEKILEQIRSVTGLKAELLEQCPPVVTGTDSPEFRRLADAVKAETGHVVRFRKMNGATDARHWKAMHKPIAIMGVEAEGCHAEYEDMTIAGWDKMFDIIRHIL